MTHERSTCACVHMKTRINTRTTREIGCERYRVLADGVYVYHSPAVTLVLPFGAQITVGNPAPFTAETVYVPALIGKAVAQLFCAIEPTGSPINKKKYSFFIVIII